MSDVSEYTYTIIRPSGKEYTCRKKYKKTGGKGGRKPDPKKKELREINTLLENLSIDQIKAINLILTDSQTQQE